MTDEASYYDDAPAPEVFIYCDSPSHTARRSRVAVTNFVSIGEGRWTERFTSTAAQGKRESGVTLIADAVPSQDILRRHGLGAFMGRSDVRSRYQLVCRKCRRHPVTAREDNLFRALSTLHEHGVAEASLTLVAATLRRQSESDGH